MRTAVATLGFLGVAVGLVALALEERDLVARVEALETALSTRAAERDGSAAEGPEAARSPDPAAAPVLEGPAVSLAAFESLAERVEGLRSRVESGAPTGEAAAPPAEGPGFDAAVRGAVERSLADDGFRRRVAEALREGRVPKKPHFRELAKALRLDDAQVQRMRDDLQDAQGALFTVLAEERPDGTSALAEIQAAEQYAEGDPRRADAFLRLTKDVVPGTRETYLERAISLAKDFRRRAAEYLRPEQEADFDRLDVDLFGVRFD